MNCDEYVGRFLSAHADNQLAGGELDRAEEHLRNCAQCRAWLAEEQELKARICHYAGIIKAPADVRLRIRAALGEASERPRRQLGIFAKAEIFARRDAARLPTHLKQWRIARSEGWIDPHRHGAAPARGWLSLQVERARYLAPVGFVVIVLAAATVVVHVTSRNTSAPAIAVGDYKTSIPAFDFAIDRFNQLSQAFTPNVPAEAFHSDSAAYFAWVVETDPLRHVSAELPDISASYEKVQMLPEFGDFALAGYELIGGRLDRMADGEPVTYTLYRDRAASLLSIGLKKHVSPPQGGYWFGNHALYSYRGYSICLTIYPTGDFVSLVVARTPMVELLRSVAVSDTALQDR